MKLSPVSDAPQMVLQLDSGHMFLQGDGNHCQEQHLGLRQLDSETANAWRKHIGEILSMPLELNCKSCFLPAPDKQSVYWGKISSQPDNRNILKILSLLNGRDYFDPLTILKCMASSMEDVDPYPKVDTHWNSLGALDVFVGVMAKFGLFFDKNFILDLIEAQKFEGDLGIKTVPKTSGIAMNLRQHVWKTLLTYDNGVPDNGRIRLFSNSSAKFSARFLIVGDSFSYRIAELASLLFSEVFHFHGSFIDRHFIRLVRPEYFIFEQTERFFIQRPRHSIESSFLRLVEEKIEAGVKIEEIISRHRLFRPELLKSHAQAFAASSSEKALKRFGVIGESFVIPGFLNLIREMKSIY